MFRNFLLITFRGFLRNKTSTLINILGLTLGLASSTLIFLYIYDELTYDTIHPHSARIYTAGITVIDKNGNREAFGETPAGWAFDLKEKFPDIEALTRFAAFGFPASIQDKTADRIVLNQDGEMYFVEQNLGTVLDLPIVIGNKEKALEQTNSMIISQSAAETLFGKGDPINRMLTIKHPFATRGKEVEFVVTGVFKDAPANTFFRPKYLLNIYGLKEATNAAGRDFDRLMNSQVLPSMFLYDYFRLKDDSHVDAINAELKRLADAATRSDSGFYASGRRLESKVKPLSELHFDEGTNWHFVDDSGSKRAVYIFGGIAVLILIIASINYMNLATARSVRRAKEVGIRKTLGSKRSELAWQFIHESGSTTLLALLLSIVAIVLLLPSFNLLTGKAFTFGSLLQPVVIALIVGLTVFVTLLGGSYPAFYLSGFRPAEVLKGIFTGGRGDGLRKTLVTFQFAVAIFLAIVTNAVINQMNLIQRSKLNEQGDQILSIRYGTVAPNEKYPTLKNALLQDKDLDLVTVANHLPRHDYFGGTIYQFRFRTIDDRKYDWNQLNGDFDFPRTYELQIVAGRDFDPKTPGDSNSYLLNERAGVELHKSLDELIGMPIENVDENKNGKVIGVVRDFPFQSAYHAISPLVISARPDNFDRIVYVKLPKGQIQEKIKFIESTWKQVMPGVGFDYWFVSDEFGRLYKKEQKIASLAKIFAALAMGITILGLYGLASYLAEQKTKEIGIRKAMGASVGQIARLFLAIFLKIFLIGSVIALPVSYYFVDGWLKTFAVRISLSPLVFLTSILWVLLLMLITILYETVKAAKGNPVVALKHE